MAQKLQQLDSKRDSLIKEKGLEKLDKIKGILEAIDNAYITEEQLFKAMKTVSTVVNKLQADVSTRVNIAEGVVGKVEKTVGLIAGKQNDTSLRFKKDTEKLQKEITDSFNTLQTKISEVEATKGDPGEKGEPGEAGNIKDLSPEEQRDNLELLISEPEEEKLKIEAVGHLRKTLDDLKEEIQKKTLATSGGGVSGRDIFADIDISSQLDGSTKTFNIAGVWNILSVSMSSFPNALRKSVDFTYTPTTITFTDEINASTSLAAGQTVVLTVVIA